MLTNLEAREMGLAVRLYETDAPSAASSGLSKSALCRDFRDFKQL
jgi:hypothetical protein